MLQTVDPFEAAALLLVPPLPAFYDDPVGWAEAEIVWPEGGGRRGLRSYQKRILRALHEHKRVAAKGPHGLGKTMMASIAILHFARTRNDARVDWKVVTTASAWRQLIKYLWPEIRKWNRRLKKPFAARELQELQLKLGHGAAFAVASDVPELIEGAHATELFYLLDEAKVIPDPTWDALEGAFSNAGQEGFKAYAMAISTPGVANGRFFEIHQHRAGLEDWHAISVSLEEAIAEGAISQDWADQRKKQWGAKSSVYINRVLGNFAAADQDGVIPDLAWIEAANERWHLYFPDAEGEGPTADPLPLLPLTCLGVDVARSGSDKTSMARRHGMVIASIEKTSLETTMETTGRVVGILNGAPVGSAWACVDVIGIGAGVVDRLRELGYPVAAFNASERSDLVDSSGELGFVNKRAAAWWTMRELLDPENGFEVALPPSDILTGDLLAPKYRVMSGGRIQVESKDDIRKRIGRSTDEADAVIQALASSEEDLLPDDTYIEHYEDVSISAY